MTRALEYVEALRSREISCEDYIAKIFERIERSDLNCYITLNTSALEEAREIDARLRRGGEGGFDGGDSDAAERRKLLLGVPVAVKDCISTKGIQTTCASKILLGYVPPFDATVVAALKKAGAIIVGKTNMDEFCMGSTTETSYFGPTLNPHDKSRVPGGSSGGSAAAIAAEETILALGSDTGGSIRCPASFCGVVGLKPTYGLVSRYGLIAYANSLEQIGPMASCVKDVALLLEVISVKDRKDSTQVKLPNNATTNFISEPILSMSEEDALNAVRGMRIGIPKEFVDGVSTDVEKAFWSAIHAFEDAAGAEYEEFEMRNMKYALAAYYIIAMSEASSNLARYDGLRYGLRFGKDEDWHATFSRIRGEGFGEEVKRRIILGTFALSAGYYGRYYLKALKVRTLVRREFESAFKKFDVLATPTMPFTPFKLGERIKDPLSLYLVDVNTVPVNLAGVPAISIPCALSPLPVGLQLIARHFEEEKLLKIALAYETLRNAHTNNK